MPIQYSLSALDPSQGVVLSGMASSVANAGDVNGDGFDDMIVGNWFADTPSTNAGEAYIVVGTASGIANQALSDGIVIGGGTYVGHLGSEVAGGGDLNGDGVGDFLATSRSSVVVGYGNASGLSNLDVGALAPSEGFKITGATNISAAFVGDVNHDGIDDIGIGTMFDDRAGAYAGAAFVIYGTKADFSDIDLTTFSSGASTGFAIVGAGAGDYAGRSISAAGDVNGDGIDDLIVGAWNAEGDLAQSGAAYVVFGKTGGPGDVDLAAIAAGTSDAGFMIGGTGKGDHAGCSVSSAGDVNGDGYDDLIVGANAVDQDTGNHPGAAYVVFGHAGGFDNLSPSSLASSDAGFVISADVGARQMSMIGTSVTAAGDMNGDGIDDLAVWAIRKTGTRVYVVFGETGAASDVDINTLGATEGFYINLPGNKQIWSSRDDLSQRVAAAGDVNGDGYSDLLIAVPGSIAGGAGGGAYIFYGAANGQDVTGTQGADTLVGTAGADIITGLGGDDHLDGGDGGDVISGGAGNDTLTGGVGDDTLDGGDGNDHLDGGDGNNTLNGGAGDDWFVGGSGADRFIGGKGFDTVTYAGSTGAIHWGAGIVSTGDAAGDVIYVNVEKIIGTDYADVLTIRDDSTTHILVGGAGSDTLTIKATYADGIMIGGAGADTFWASRYSSVSYAGSSKGVHVNLKTGEAYGGDAAGDTFHHVYNLIGSVHGDTLIGSDHHTGVYNHLSGAGGNDRLIGADVREVLDGGAGDDVLKGHGGGDTFSGGRGDDRLIGGSTADDMEGDKGQDLLVGRGGHDRMYGGAGKDVLAGGGGGDSLDGGGGRDVLYGGAGLDGLTGGPGRDVFLFRSVSDSHGRIQHFDKISDYSAGDVIDLRHIDADVTKAGNQAFHLNHGGTRFSGKPGELLLYHADGHVVLVGDVNGNGHIDFGINFYHLGGTSVHIYL